MSTIQDLNTARTITYNDEADYAIVFGANAGNITANVDSYASANITQQTTLTSITSPVRDLLLDVQFSNVGNVSMAYVGTYSNIGLLQVAPAAWRVNGIRSVAQYTEAFANVKFTDLTGASNISPEYSYITTVNDQSGNTRNWTTTVNVITQPSISITGNVIYNEDTLANVTIANVVVDPTSVVTFRLYANTAVGNGTMTDGVVTGNSIFIDGNATSLNTQIAAGAFKFLPASDLASNVGNAITFAIGNTTAIFNTANANIQIANTHAEFNFSDGTYTEDTRLAFGNTITDLDTRALSFTIGIQQTAGNAGVFYQSNVAVAGNANTRLNVTGSRAAINNTIEWMPPVDYTGNVSFTYNQVKTLATGNVTQASNVVANFTAVTNPEISNMIARTITANAVANIFATTTPVINDGPDYGQTYTITLSSPVGRFGNSAANAIAANTYSYTGNTTQVNNEFTNMKFVNDFGVGAQTSSFTYTQSRDGTAQVNTSPVLTISAGSVANTYTRSITSNSTFAPTTDQVLFGNIQIFAVGAGGAGHSGGSTGPRHGGGGGGGGSVYDVSAVRGTANALQSATYSVTVGSGGVNDGQSGGNSYLTLSSTNYFVAIGGGGGDDNDGGGSYYNSTLRAGGTGGLVSNNGVGGGGASPAGAGDSFSGLNAGDGAAGYVSTISGSSVYYGAGGGGGVFDATGTPNPVPGTGGTGGGGNGSGLPGGGPAGDGSGYGAGGGGGTTSNWGTGYQGIVIIKIS
jgi:hypothetical protein